MAERRPDLAREHRLHDRFRGPPRASPVRFQVSRPADRTSRGWARGVPLAECRFPGPATRRLGRLRRESERSTAPGICAPLRENLWWCVVVVVVAATPNYLRQASQNLGKYHTLSARAAVFGRYFFLWCPACLTYICIYTACLWVGGRASYVRWLPPHAPSWRLDLKKWCRWFILNKLLSQKKCDHVGRWWLACGQRGWYGSWRLPVRVSSSSYDRCAVRALCLLELARSREHGGSGNLEGPEHGGSRDLEGPGGFRHRSTHH